MTKIYSIVINNNVYNINMLFILKNMRYKYCLLLRYCLFKPYNMIGAQGSYQGQGGFNQYPGTNDQYGQHYPPSNTSVGYPSGPVRPPIYPPYSNDVER